LAACQTRRPVEADVLILGLRLPREELQARLDARVEAMFAAGLAEEVRRLRAAGYGESRPLREAMGYKEVSAHLDGEISLAEAVALTKAAHRRLARRQAAWFKPGDARIRWVDAGPDAAATCVKAVRGWLRE
jgi:tRNA dimethylallyltransferase